MGTIFSLITVGFLYLLKFSVEFFSGKESELYAYTGAFIIVLLLVASCWVGFKIYEWVIRRDIWSQD